MRDNYDFSNGKKNPYVKRTKRQITINVDDYAIDYFKSLALQVGIPYQTLINLYLMECAKEKRRINLTWE